MIDSGVLLTMRDLCLPRGRRGNVWEEVLTAFGDCDDIDFAYPTQRLYYNAAEGKLGARAHGRADLQFPTHSEPR